MTVPDDLTQLPQEEINRLWEEAQQREDDDVPAAELATALDDDEDDDPEQHADMTDVPPEAASENAPQEG